MILQIMEIRSKSRFSTLSECSLSARENDSFAIQKLSNLFVPAGYLAFLFDQAPEDLRAAGMEMIIDVKGVWECRELA